MASVGIWLGVKAAILGYLVVIGGGTPPQASSFRAKQLGTASFQRPRDQAAYIYESDEIAFIDRASGDVFISSRLRAVGLEPQGPSIRSKLRGGSNPKSKKTGL